jgi:hypothetical protein
VFTYAQNNSKNIKNIEQDSGYRAIQDIFIKKFGDRIFRPNSGTVRKLDNILYRFGFSAKTKYILAREDFSKTT